MTRWDGRQHKVKIVGYELVVGKRGPYNTLVWVMHLECGHSVTRASGRPATPGQFGACDIGGMKYVGVMKSVSCDTCRAGVRKAEPMSEENKTPCIPVATLAAPRSMEMQPIGFVAASGEWMSNDSKIANEFEVMTRDLAVKLAKKAVEQFPTAKALYNFRWSPGRGYHGYYWHDGTADVYGEIGTTFGAKHESKT